MGRGEGGEGDSVGRGLGVRETVWAGGVRETVWAGERGVRETV